MKKTEILIDAIQDFFGDTSRSTQETIEGLTRAQQHIAMLLETLEDEEDEDSE